ncbi:MAG: OmpA family protein, partial [Pyrinomonadaceae bacterium]
NKDNEQALYSTAELLQKKFQSRPEFSSHKDQIKVDMTDEGLRIQIVDKADRVSFGSASAQVTPEAEAILKEIALGICELPNLLRIGGHTDRHVFPPSSPYTNWELSADRANAARRVLNANCVRPEQISRIVGYADTELINPSDPYSHDNRRISIVVLRLKQAEAGDTSGSKQEGEGAGRVVEESPRDAAPKATPKSEDEEQPKGGDGESTRPAEATPKASGHADDGKHETDPKPSRPTRDGEKRLSSRKLADRNSVSVGTPDQIPANVQRLREPARPAKER